MLQLKQLKKAKISLYIWLFLQIINQNNSQCVSFYQVILSVLSIGILW